MDKKGVSCISVNGLLFKHFINIAKSTGIRVCVITDNDNDIVKVGNFKTKLKEIYNSDCFEVFYDLNSCRRTLEICLYEDNKELIDETLILKEGD